MSATEPTDSTRMSKSERRQTRILRTLMDGNSAQIKDLADMLNVSLMTIHRDLNHLDREGLVHRVRGSVSAEKSLLFESSYNYRDKKQLEEKKALAKAAVGKIEPGNAIVCDDSTTTFHICDYIDAVTPLTVLTNAVPVLEALRPKPDIDLIALGGHYHRGYNAYFGTNCEQAIQSYHVDLAIMSTTTIQGLSLYTQNEQVLRAKQAMMRIAHRTILLADSTKFHFSALNYVADVTDFDLVLLTGDIPLENLDLLTRASVNFEIV